MAAQKADSGTASFQEIESILHKEGFIKTERVTDSLQGSVWKAQQWATKQEVVIKVTNRELHERGVVILHGKTIPVYEDCMKEKHLLRYLTKKHEKEAPPSIVKYVDFFKSESWYFLVMQNGGNSLFDFVSKAHQYILEGRIEIGQWRKMVKVMFSQMLQSVEYIHQKNICHHDISLENFIINDLSVSLSDDDMIQFDPQDVQVKLCDFGLAEAFEPDAPCESNKFCGKPCYKSPELVEGKTFDAESNDIWALGVCLFTMCIGGMPFLNAKPSDHRYAQLMKPKGIRKTLKHWKKLKMVDENIIQLLQSIMLPQRERASIAQIKQNPFLR